MADDRMTSADWDAIGGVVNDTLLGLSKSDLGPMDGMLGLVRSMAIIAALPREVWPGAGSVEDRLESNLVLLREFFASHDVVPLAREVSAVPTPEANIVAATRVVWPLVARAMGRYTPTHVVFGVGIVMVEASIVQGDPPRMASWLLAELRRQFDRVSEPSFEWPPGSIPFFRRGDA